MEAICFFETSNSLWTIWFQPRMLYSSREVYLSYNNHSLGIHAHIFSFNVVFQITVCNLFKLKPMPVQIWHNML
jgi:hypothetical protein